MEMKTNTYTIRSCCNACHTLPYRIFLALIMITIPLLTSCNHNSGTTTYTYKDAGLYLTIEVYNYYRSRLYLSDDPKVYGANYVDIKCSLKEEPGIYIYFKQADPQLVNIIDRFERITGVRSSDINIHVSSSSTDKQVSLVYPWTLSATAKANNTETDSISPYVWYRRIEWFDDPAMFLTPSLVYTVGESLNYVGVYEDFGDNEGMISLGSAEVVRYKFSWKTLFYHLLRIQ